MDQASGEILSDNREHRQSHSQNLCLLLCLAARLCLGGSARESAALLPESMQLFKRAGVECERRH